MQSAFNPHNNWHPGEGLWGSHDRARELLNDMPLGFYLVTPEGIITDANPAFVRMMGFPTRQSLLGIELRELYVNPRAQQVQDMERKEVLFQRLDGTVLWAKQTIRTIRDSNGLAVRFEGFVEDLSELNEARAAQRELERELQRLNRSHQVLSECNQTLIRSRSEGVLLDEILNILIGTGEYQLAWIGLTGAEGKIERVLHKVGDLEDCPQERQVLQGLPDQLPPYAAEALETGKTVVERDISVNVAGTGALNAPGGGSPCVRISLPLHSSEGRLGVLAIYSSDPNAFDPDEIRLLEELASDLAYGITADRVYLQKQQAEAKIRRQVQYLASLRDINVAIGASFDLSLILGILLDKLTGTLELDAARVLLLKPQTAILQYTTGRGFRGPATQRSHFYVGEGYAGMAAMKRKMIVIPNVDEHNEEPLYASLMAAEGFLAYASVPLIAKGQVKGVIEVFHRAPLSPDQEWRDFLQSLADQAAIAIDNAGLFSDLYNSKNDLVRAYDTTIEGWSRALDLRDKETEGHSQRVTELTLQIATEFPLGAEEMMHIRRGALLHDIGKMGVPDLILLKPSSLTAEEMAIMRKHPRYAYDLLSPIAYLRPALDIPYCHHEKWDGTGYPRGLRGEQIPLAARIFAVADVWDALLSDRPYRKAWTAEAAMNYIISQAGKHFDPKVVEVFTRIAPGLNHSGG